MKEIPWLVFLTVMTALLSACGNCGPHPGYCFDDDLCVEYNEDPSSGGYGLGLVWCVDQMCRECRTTADCDGSCAECINNSCRVRGDGCTSDDQCPAGSICNGCSCMAPCYEDSCPGAMRCCDWGCCDCFSDEDCPADYLCEDGSCLDVHDGCTTRRFEAVYFDFDEATIRHRDEYAIEVAYDCLTEWPTDDIIIEGHTDERGTDAYNLALGERRAQMVRDSLLEMGVDEDRIAQTISYGEIRPAANGHTESSWRQNRRAEFVWE